MSVGWGAAASARMWSVMGTYRFHAAANSILCLHDQQVRKLLPEQPAEHKKRLALQDTCEVASAGHPGRGGIVSKEGGGEAGGGD